MRRRRKNKEERRRLELQRRRVRDESRRERMEEDETGDEHVRLLEHTMTTSVLTADEVNALVLSRFGNCAHRSVFYVDEQDNWNTIRYTRSAIICVIGTISVLAFWVSHWR